MSQIQVVTKFERVLGLCIETRDRANSAARFLGFPEYHPAKPQTTDAAIALLEDLRALRFDLKWKAELKAEGMSRMMARMAEVRTAA